MQNTLFPRNWEYQVNRGKKMKLLLGVALLNWVPTRQARTTDHSPGALLFEERSDQIAERPCHETRLATRKGNY